MIRFYETIILYLILVIFAVVGVTYLAPAIAQKVSQHLEKAAKVEPGKVRL